MSSEKEGSVISLADHRSGRDTKKTSKNAMGRGGSGPASRGGGSGVPGSGVPGSGVPGSGVPGSGRPGSGRPGTYEGQDKLDALKMTSDAILAVIEEASAVVPLDELAGIFAIYARDLAELSLFDMPESIDKAEILRVLKRILCERILMKSRTI